MFTLTFWKATLERAIRGGALVASAALGAAAWGSVDEAVAVAPTAALGFLWGFAGSVLLSLAGAQVGAKGSPSFTDNERIL